MGTMVKDMPSCKAALLFVTILLISSCVICLFMDSVFIEFYLELADGMRGRCWCRIQPIWYVVSSALSVHLSVSVLLHLVAPISPLSLDRSIDKFPCHEQVIELLSLTHSLFWKAFTSFTSGFAVGVYSLMPVSLPLKSRTINP